LVHDLQVYLCLRKYRLGELQLPDLEEGEIPGKQIFTTLQRVGFSFCVVGIRVCKTSRF
jgi:hypothetical protein